MEYESFQIQFCSMNANIRINGDVNDCLFYLPKFEINTKHHIYISVVSASIPFSFYNVNARNNMLNITVNGINQNISIPFGNYNITQYMAKLQSLLTGFTITYDTITSKITFTNNNNYNFILNGSSSTCMRMLGFPPSVDGVSSLNSNNFQSVTAPEPVNMVFSSNISIYSNIRSKSFNAKHTNNQFLLCTIPIETQPFSMITYKNYYGTYKVNTYSNNLDMLEIKICDQCGDEIDLNNADWTLTIQFDIVKH